MTLTGGELAESSLTVARGNPDLVRIDFRAMDMLDIPGQYDCITANAVTYLFNHAEYEKAVASIACALRPNGTFISFDWYHAFDGQDLAITEFTAGHPDGIVIHARPYSRVSDIFRKAGLDGITFQPFRIPIDLPEPEDKSGDPITFTVKQENGDRLCMRGHCFNHGVMSWRRRHSNPSKQPHPIMAYVKWACGHDCDE